MRKDDMLNQYILEELESIHEITRKESGFRRFNVALGYAIDEILLRSDVQNFEKELTCEFSINLKTT